MTQVNSQVELTKFSGVIRELFEEFSELLINLDASQHEKLMDLFVMVGVVVKISQGSVLVQISIELD